MNAPLLHTVLNDLLCAVDRYPEVAESVGWFVFDGDRAIREGIYVVKTDVAQEVLHLDGSIGVRVGVEVLASDDLVQFAHAVANGVIPHMPLRTIAATG